MMKTTGPATKLALKADRARIRADGEDLSFVTLTVEDKHGLMVPRANRDPVLPFPGRAKLWPRITATPPIWFVSLPHDRKAFNGLCLAIIRAKAGQTGTIKLTATADHLKTAKVSIEAE